MFAVNRIIALLYMYEAMVAPYKICPGFKPMADSYSC